MAEKKQREDKNHMTFQETLNTIFEILEEPLPEKLCSKYNVNSMVGVALLITAIALTIGTGNGQFLSISLVGICFIYQAFQIKADSATAPVVEEHLKCLSVKPVRLSSEYRITFQSDDIPEYEFELFVLKKDAHNFVPGKNYYVIVQMGHEEVILGCTECESFDE